MKLLLILIAAILGWRFLIRPWFTARSPESEPELRQFKGQEIREADFEEMKPEEDKKEHL